MDQIGSDKLKRKGMKTATSSGHMLWRLNPRLTMFLWYVSCIFAPYMTLWWHDSMIGREQGIIVNDCNSLPYSGQRWHTRKWVCWTVSSTRAGNQLLLPSMCPLGSSKHCRNLRLVIRLGKESMGWVRVMRKGHAISYNRNLKGKKFAYSKKQCDKDQFRFPLIVLDAGCWFAFTIFHIHWQAVLCLDQIFQVGIGLPLVKIWNMNNIEATRL